MNFDTEKFIHEIKTRKAIWDPSLDEYADRDCRRRLWDEVTSSMFEDDIAEDDRRDISRLLQQKWKNIRTSFTRELRRRAGKSGLADSRKTPYVYFDKLKFLWTNENNKTQQNDDTGISQGENVLEDIASCQSTTRKKRRFDIGEDNLDEVLSRCNAKIERSKKHLGAELDTDRLFILSLVDDFKNIPDNRKLSAKLEIIKILKWAQTPQDNALVPPNKTLYSDHDYARGCNKIMNHSIHPNLQQVIVDDRFSVSCSDISNGSDFEESDFEEA